MLCYPSQGSRPQFHRVMPRPDVIWVAFTLQFDMGGARSLWLRRPSDRKQGLVHAFCFAARPVAHKKCIDLGGFLRCSVRSASTRKARATAATSASPLVGPYAITPGSSGMSANQRPSSSCSNSTLNDSESGGCPGGLVAVATSFSKLLAGYGGAVTVAENLSAQRSLVKLNFCPCTSPYLCST